MGDACQPGKVAKKFSQMFAIEACIKTKTAILKLSLAFLAHEPADKQLKYSQDSNCYA